MTKRVVALLLTPLILAALSGTAQGQLPQRGPEPVTRGDPAAPPLVPVREPTLTRDPTVAPPLPAAEPAVLAPQPAVQPGTVQPRPVLRASREMRYLPAGEAPGAVQVTATGPGSVTLSWTAPAGATGYRIHQAAPGQTTYYTGSTVTETSATVTSLRPATAYSFKVSAMYPQEMQRADGMSAAVAATTAAAPVPTGFTATIVGRGKVDLRWGGLAGADGFRVSRNDTTLKDIKRMANYPLATTLADSVLPGTHRYRVQAVYRAAGLDQGADVLSAAAQAAVTIPASSRVRFCQTRAGDTRCSEPDASIITVALNSRSVP
jgi:Fibronectin type III domain